MLCVDLEKPVKAIVVMSLGSMQGVMIEMRGGTFNVRYMKLDRVTIERDKVVIEAGDQTLVTSEKRPYTCTLDDVVVKVRYELYDLLRRLLSI